MPNIIAPDPAREITTPDGKMQEPFRIWASLITKLDIIVGTGSPEGVVEAEQTRLYMDDSGTAGNILYIKRDTDIGGDRAKGWILT